MNASDRRFRTVDEYIETFSPEVQTILGRIRSIIKEAAPQAQERIAYGIPTYWLGTNLVHFAAFKHHIGLYPTPDGIEVFSQDLSGYTNAKGSVRFPLDGEIPFDLIDRIVRYRVASVTGIIKK